MLSAVEASRLLRMRRLTKQPGCFGERTLDEHDIPCYSVLLLHEPLVVGRRSHATAERICGGMGAPPTGPTRPPGKQKKTPPQ